MRQGAGKLPPAGALQAFGHWEKNFGRKRGSEHLCERAPERSKAGLHQVQSVTFHVRCPWLASSPGSTFVRPGHWGKRGQMRPGFAVALSRCRRLRAKPFISHGSNVTNIGHRSFIGCEFRRSTGARNSVDRSCRKNESVARIRRKIYAAAHFKVAVVFWKRTDAGLAPHTPTGQLQLWGSRRKNNQKPFCSGALESCTAGSIDNKGLPQEPAKGADSPSVESAVGALNLGPLGVTRDGSGCGWKLKTA